MRGQINNRARAAQIRDFSGLRYGNITPTDIDGVIEYKDCAWIIIELKAEGAQCPRGQELALERMGRDLSAQKPTLVIVASHNAPVDQDIDTAGAIVDKIYWCGKWQFNKSGQTVSAVISDFLKYVGTRQATIPA